MVVQHNLMTVEAFEAWINLPENEDRWYELVDGEIVEKPKMPTQEHGRAAKKIIVALGHYQKLNPIGYTEIQVVYRPAEDDFNVRQPDISFFMDVTTPPAKGVAPRLPELAIEIKSPSNSFKALREKARWYLANRSRMVWLVFVEQQVIEVYTLTDEFVLGIHDTLTGGDLLPGFSLPVAAIFAV